MPEYRNSPNPAYQNERVRGTGGRPTSFGEENLLTLPIDRYDDESIGVHEFCHTVDGALGSIETIGRMNGLSGQEGSGRSWLDMGPCAVAGARAEARQPRSPAW